MHKQLEQKNILPLQWELWQLTMKTILLFTCFLVSIHSFASEMEMADIYESYKSGSLPMPYGPFSVLLKTSQSHSVTQLSVMVNGIYYPIKDDNLSKLNNIDASDFVVGYEIYRKKEAPYEKHDSTVRDFLEIRIGALSGISKDHTWYGDYFTILINLETSDVRVAFTNHVKPKM